MTTIDRLTRSVRSKLARLGVSPPSATVLRSIINISYLASFKTEEGRFVRGSITFADPSSPDDDPPIIRRADYPAFTPFGRSLPLTVETLVKLSRAIDRWSGSIAVYGTRVYNLVAWGVLDQQVHLNVRFNREGEGGAAGPGIVTIAMDGIAELSVYHSDLFLGALRQDRVISQENDALNSHAVTERIIPYLTPVADRIACALGTPEDAKSHGGALFDAWTDTISRLCIGLRRAGTGGAFLISPAPIYKHLNIKHQFSYSRLGGAAILGALDSAYRNTTREKLHTELSPLVNTDLVIEHLLAAADADDRGDELTGAVKLVTSLAALDGIVLLSPLLSVRGFGIKLSSTGPVGKIYDGADFARKGTQAKVIDPTRFGTRHNSMLSYCREDRRSIGIVVSQDGQVRLIVTARRSLTLWDNVKLLKDSRDLDIYARHRRQGRAFRDQRRHEATLGYTAMPKTLSQLMNEG